MVKFLVGISAVKVFSVLAEVSLPHWQENTSVTQLVEVWQRSQKPLQCLYLDAKC